MEMQERDTTDDWISLLMLLTGAGGMGLFSVAHFIRPVRDALVEWGVLVEDQILIPIGEGVGFDIWRVLLGAGLIVGFVTICILIARRRARYRPMGRRNV